MLLCCSVSQVLLFVTPWSVACQDSLSVRFSRQEYWSGLQFPSPGDLPNPGIELRSPALQADSLLTELQGKPKEYNKSDFGIDHLVMSMCRVFSCVVRRVECICYDQCVLLAKLLAFALLHSVLQGQICLLPQVFWEMENHFGIPALRTPWTV